LEYIYEQMDSSYIRILSISHQPCNHLSSTGDPQRNPWVSEPGPCQSAGA
jgi:hypothetical protein